MNIILSFIGPLPNYIIECIHQIRLYTNDNIYLILNDYSSPILMDLFYKYKISLVKYEDVFDHNFKKAIDANGRSFWYMGNIKGREELFTRSIERFFLANNLIIKKNLENNLFIEIDNLIYQDPNIWLKEFIENDIAFMSHSLDHCSSGIFYIKNKNSLNHFLVYTINYILTARYEDCPSEMKCLSNYFREFPDKMQLIPTIFEDKINNVNSIAYMNYNNYKSVFDPAYYGIYLLGEDPIHNKGEIIYGKSFEHFFIKCYNYKFKWIIDDKDLRKPYIYNDETKEWILLNNLHVHSKNLIEGLSKPININIISGEKIQKLANLYLGEDEGDFLFNPNIGKSNKNMLIKDIPFNFDNPKIIYCYSNRLLKLYEKLNNFKNKFILISGNSDENIKNDLKKIADHEKIIKWHTQNLCILHDKISLFPIGVANKQWKHGNIKELTKIINMNIPKTNNIYFNFNINTNFNKRIECYNKISKYVIPLNNIDEIDNFKRLASYKFSICPEGNGTDTHRLWECWYLKVIPIVLKSDFIDVLLKNIDLPIIILNDWDDIDINMDYNNYNFKNYNKYLDFTNYKFNIIF